MGELSGNIDVLSYTDGPILLQIEAGSQHTRVSAGVRISPDGKNLYASNRLGMEGVAVFDILTDGTLCPFGCIRPADCPVILR